MMFNDLADIGALARRRKRSMRGGTNARRLIPKVPGVPARGLGEQPLGLGATAFTAGSGTSLNLTASPQRPFRGRRLIIDITRTGATATGLVTITRLDIGVDNQLPGSGAITAGAFSPTAVGVDLDMDPCTPGVNVTLTLNISAAPGAADRVDCAGTIIGESVR